MGDNNIQDVLEVFVSVIMYAAAVSVLVFAVSYYTDGLDFLEERIDEKQSVEIDSGTSIGIKPGEEKKDELNKAEVINSILELEDPMKTSVTINGATLDASTIILAKEGNEKGVQDIESKLGSYGKYIRKNIYDTNNGQDYLQTVEFTGV